MQRLYGPVELAQALGMPVSDTSEVSIKQAGDKLAIEVLDRSSYGD